MYHYSCAGVVPLSWNGIFHPPSNVCHLQNQLTGHLLEKSSMTPLLLPRIIRLLPVLLVDYTQFNFFTYYNLLFSLEVCKQCMAGIGPYMSIVPLLA